MYYLLYIVATFLQPICWPLPEVTTILFGVELIGSFKAFIIGYVFIILGIIFMYKFSFFLSNKYLDKFKRKKSFKKFQIFIQENEILTTGILFILPILPDEVICIGSAIVGIRFKTFLSIALVAKFICIFMYAYSNQLALLLNINEYLLIIIQLLIILIISIMYNKNKTK